MAIFYDITNVNQPVVIRINQFEIPLVDEKLKIIKGKGNDGLRLLWITWDRLFSSSFEWTDLVVHIASLSAIIHL